jgi:hypothetical protein
MFDGLIRSTALTFHHLRAPRVSFGVLDDACAFHFGGKGILAVEETKVCDERSRVDASSGGGGWRYV